jgi:hypothetical protein
MFRSQQIISKFSFDQVQVIVSAIDQHCQTNPYCPWSNHSQKLLIYENLNLRAALLVHVLQLWKQTRAQRIRWDKGQIGFSGNDKNYVIRTSVVRVMNREPLHSYLDQTEISVSVYCIGSDASEV